MERCVCYHPLAPTFTVSDAILDKWTTLGAEHGMLGFPIRPMHRYKALDSTVMVFQRGRIISHPQRGTFYVTGTIERLHADHLGIQGAYGFPTADPQTIGSVTSQAFEGGTIHVDAQKRADCVDLRPEIMRRGIAIRNQMGRPTCSVQAMVFLLEYQYSRLLSDDFAHLSVEYSNHFANVVEGDREDGHCFFQCEHGYDQYGIVRERLWPYAPTWPYAYEHAQALATEDMIQEGKRMLHPSLHLSGRYLKPLGDSKGLTDAQFSDLLDTLCQGIPVAVGRDHSLVAVGYRMDANAAGGGMFLFRNSYGTNMDFSGYQEESFQSVRETVNDMFAYDPPH